MPDTVRVALPNRTVFEHVHAPARKINCGCVETKAPQTATQVREQSQLEPVPAAKHSKGDVNH